MKPQHNTYSNFVFAEVALPVPLRQIFDYKIPDELKGVVVPGIRVVVPFGRRDVSGLIIKIKTTTKVQLSNLKSIQNNLDNQPVISLSLLKLIQWASAYYQHPLGEVIKTALPGVYESKLSDKRKVVKLINFVNLQEANTLLSKAPRQKEIFNFIAGADTQIELRQLQYFGGGWRRALNDLIKKQLVQIELIQDLWQPGIIDQGDSPPLLSSPQEIALKQLSGTLDKFKVTLLKGVTGSGKTEIYLQLARLVLDQGKQVLILVPEIALTIQLVSRFERRLGLSAAILHSALAEKTRRSAWWASSNGVARVVIGTRSAVFTSMVNPGLIILDEEHDASYKQQEGFRYHARDLAIMRAKLENIPVLLGSATPSLESLANVKRAKYRLCELNERVGNAKMPAIHLLSIDQLPVKEGLSTTLINAIEKNLLRRQQTLIFINRRGFAPIVLCKACGEQVICNRCNARLTYHHDASLRCHHCGSQQIDSGICQTCKSNSLVRLGQGTQRIEQTLNRLFPKAKIARLDRDAIQRKDDLHTILENVIDKNIDILIGTQMLSKGHDFPGVTLVGVLNADQGLFGIDFHATESMIQQLIQVSGRAGRAGDPGKVLIQTCFPDHPLYTHVSHHNYMAFASQELRLRQQAGFPPYHHLALIRASAHTENTAIAFLTEIKQIGQRLILDYPQIKIMEPVSSPMAKRRGRYRAQLLISSKSRSARQNFLTRWINQIENNGHRRKVRWSVDVDPIDLY